MVLPVNKIGTRDLEDIVMHVIKTTEAIMYSWIHWRSGWLLPRSQSDDHGFSSEPARRMPESQGLMVNWFDGCGSRTSFELLAMDLLVHV